MAKNKLTKKQKRAKKIKVYKKVKNIIKNNIPKDQKRGIVTMTLAKALRIANPRFQKANAERQLKKMKQLSTKNIDKEAQK